MEGTCSIQRSPPRTGSCTTRWADASATDRRSSRQPPIRRRRIGVNVRKASREDAQAFRLLIDRAESDSSPLGVAVRDVLGLVGERALVLHGPEELAGEEHGGDLDCAIQGMDPWWPLKLAGPWRL